MSYSPFWLIFLFICASNQNSAEKRPGILLRFSPHISDLEEPHEILDSNEAPAMNHMVRELSSKSLSETNHQPQQFFTDMFGLLSRRIASNCPASQRAAAEAVAIDPGMIRIEGPDKQKPAKMKILNPSIWEAIRERGCDRQLVFNLRNTSSVPTYGDLSGHVTTPESEPEPACGSVQDIAQQIKLLNTTIQELQKKMKNTTGPTGWRKGDICGLEDILLELQDKYNGEGEI